MNREEAVKLCRLVKTVCPAQAIDPWTPDAWVLILGSLPYDDAKQAVAELTSLPLEPGKARYIEPGHIIGQVLRIREKRMAAIPMPEPPPGLGAGQYLNWLRGTRRAIASGTYTPAPEPKQIASREQIAALIHQATPEGIDR